MIKPSRSLSGSCMAVSGRAAARRRELRLWLLSSFHALLSPVESINSCVIPASRLCLLLLLLLLLAFSTY